MFLDISGVREGKYTYVFASPELAMSQQWVDIWKSAIYQKVLCGICFDEAHCIAIW